MEKAKHTHSSFDTDLENIANILGSMSELVVDVSKVFIASLSNPSGETIDKVREIDNKVNELDEQIEKLSTNIIALRHPFAVDLRFVISATKISTIIERQGDMIESAVRKVLRVEKEITDKYKNDLVEIVESSIEMLRYAIEGYKNQDTMLANKVWRIEDRVDDISDEVFADIKEEIRKNPEKVDDYISLMLVVRNLERIADYCTKITKAVHYVTSGERVKEGDF